MGRIATSFSDTSVNGPECKRVVKTIVGVVGSGHSDPETDALAEEVGRLIAKEGFILLNGGLGGVMAASARGCKAGGGTVIGILPGADPASANEHTDVPLATGLGEMRNFLIVRASHAVIAIGGGYGTLSEISLALKTKKPVVGLKTWDISGKIIRADGPRDAVTLAATAAGR